MSEASAELDSQRHIWTGIGTCAVLQIAVAMLVAFANFDPLSWLVGSLGPIFVAGILPTAIVFSLARQGVERRRGKAPFEGAWAVVMWARGVFQLALLGTLPALVLALLIAWLAGGPSIELGRALITLLAGGVVVGVIGGLAGNVLNLIAVRRRMT